MSEVSVSIDQPGFFKQSDLPEQVNKAEMIQKVLTGREGMVVWSKIKASTYTAAHSHPNEQIPGAWISALPMRNERVWRAI